MDIKTGVDLLVAKKRIEAQRKLDKHRTKVVVLSPPCSRFSQIRKYFQKNKEVASSEQKDAEAFELLQFAMDVANSQHRNGRMFIFEHLAGAPSWQLVSDAPGSAGPSGLITSNPKLHCISGNRLSLVNDTFWWPNSII